MLQGTECEGLGWGGVAVEGGGEVRGEGGGRREREREREKRREEEIIWALHQRFSPPQPSLPLLLLPIVEP